MDSKYYINLINEIENRISYNLSLISSIVKYKPYSSLKSELKMYHFQATDSKYLSRIVNDPKALERSNIYKKYLDVINIIIYDINLFFSTYDEYVKYYASLDTIDDDNLFKLIEIYSNLLNDYSYSNYLYISEYESIRQNAMKKALDDLDYVIINCLIIKAYGRTRYHFRARGYVNEIKNIVLNYDVNADTYSLICTVCDICASFYISVLDVMSSCEFKYKAAMASYTYDIDTSVGYLCDFYRTRARIARNVINDLDTEYINEKYPEYSEKIIKLSAPRGLKIDPIEHTTAFLALYDEVMEEVEAIIDVEGDLHLCHQRWQLMRSAYLKRGIDWKSPAMMNPRVRFD